MLLDLLLRAKFPKEHRELVGYYVSDIDFEALGFISRFRNSPLNDVAPVDSQEYDDLIEFWYSHYYARLSSGHEDYYSWT